MYLDMATHGKIALLHPPGAFSQKSGEGPTGGGPAPRLSGQSAEKNKKKGHGGEETKRGDAGPGAKGGGHVKAQQKPARGA